MARLAGTSAARRSRGPTNESARDVGMTVWCSRTTMREQHNGSKSGRWGLVNDFWVLERVALEYKENRRISQKKDRMGLVRKDATRVLAMFETFLVV